jgi:hypothetical protein
MTDFMTPRGHMANLVAMSKSATPFGQIGVCPLTLNTIQLLPVRYGLVEPGLDPRADMAMPYTLQSRPLGLRRLRDGFLYVIDNAIGLLSEYTVKDGSLEYSLLTGEEIKALRPPLGDPPEITFSRRSVLYVAYSETQWTIAKCRQVIENASEREHFMQRIDLTQTTSENIVAPLIHQRHAKKWLAEVAPPHEMPQDGITPEENTPYQWEHTPLFRKTLIEELTSQVANEQKMDYLFLAVRDDLGVMRDLASYQDKVVGWIGDWANSGEQEGNTERDYLLGCYIESLSQISVANLSKMALDSPDPAVKALMQDLQKLPEPQREQTGLALVDFLSEDPVANPLPGVSDQNLPPELETKLQNIRLTADRGNAYSVLPKLEQTIEHYFLEQKLAVAGPDFLARHSPVILQIDRQQNKRLRDLLYGAGFGRRGINDLIDRARMDAFLKEQRPKLAHWNALLDRITHDRLEMLTQDRFHRAAWYFDSNDPEQIDQALIAQYACLKDICRSDTALDKVLAWLDDNLQQSRPLFHTLPLSVQTEIGTQFAVFTNAGWNLLKNAPEWTEKLQTLFAGHLPDVETLPHTTQIYATAAWGTLAPAMQWGVHNALQTFMQALDKGQMPDIEALFRYMPKTLGVSMLDAARREKVSFQVADADDLKALGKLVKEVQEERQYLRYLNNEIRSDKKAKKYSYAQDMKDRRTQTQERLKPLEERLAGAMSPLRELPDRAVHLQAATSVKPGLALVLQNEQHVQVRSLMENYRLGVSVAPKAGLIGDGVGLLVFVAQLVNFVQVWREVKNSSDEQKGLSPILSPLVTTAAAGFGAVQGMADTALNAQATHLSKALKAAELKSVHVQMGKLHIGLGTAGYFVGAVASLININASHSNWLNAAREGNVGAQAGAALSMAGSSGYFLSNGYGLQQSGMALKNVLDVIWQPEARAAAWAIAGPRLATVFFRTTVAGILFTALELSGTWLYNRYNLSRHDRWLQSTPWSQFPEQRLSLPIETFQTHLHAQAKAPKIEVLVSPKNDQGVQSKRVRLHFPITSHDDLMNPLNSNAAKTMLQIGAYKVRTHTIKGPEVERWSVVTDSLFEDIQIIQAFPLILESEVPADWSRPTATEQDDVVITAMFGDLRPQDGNYELNIYQLRAALYGSSEQLADIHLKPQGDECNYLSVKPLQLPHKDD